MPESEFVTADGVRIRARKDFTARDKGVPLVALFHGFSFSLDDWVKLGTLDLLSSHGYSYAAIDLPEGKASKSDKISKRDFSEAIPIIKETLEKLGAEKESLSNLAIIGPSMGGGFALAYAIQNREDVKGLILISPSLKDIPEDQLEELDVPTLLVWGEKDNIFSVESHARKLKNLLPRSKLLIIKGAGHAAYLNRPEEFHELLFDFLEEIFS